jgi:membrane associated rhomboid family serine protease
VLNLPLAVTAVIVLLLAVHALRQAVSFETDLAWMRDLAFVPARLALWWNPDGANAVLDAFLADAAPGSETARQRLVVFRYFAEEGGVRLWTLLTYGLLHGSWLHVGMNVLWLAVFGSPVARRLGTPGFVVLLLAGTVAGALAHAFVRPDEAWPLIGASAGVSAMTGAAALFVFARGAMARGALGDGARVQAVPALAPWQLWRNPSALSFIALWFATNWLFGAGVVPLAGAGESIAWEAHVGGFLAGLALFALLDRGARER